MRKPQKNEAFPEIAETADEATAALARGQIVARGELALFATHDWRAQLYRRVQGEPWDRAGRLVVTSTHRVGDGEDEFTPGRFCRDAGVAFAAACDAFDLDGTIDFPGYHADEQRVSASLGKDWRADLGKRVKPNVAEPVPTFAACGEWHFDPAELLAWSRAHRGDALWFMDPEIHRFLLFMASDVARIGTTLPDDASCWLDEAGLHYRWRDGKGGLNRIPLYNNEVPGGAELCKLELRRPDAQRAA